MVALGLIALSPVPTAQGQEATAPLSTPPAADQLIDPVDIPSVHNTFYAVPEGAVSWDTLAGLEIEAEVLGPLRTRFTTSYSDQILALDGQQVLQNRKTHRASRRVDGARPGDPACAALRRTACAVGSLASSLTCWRRRR